MSYTIIFNKNASGGLGDRITGIMSVMGFARIFEKKFKMCWHIPVEKIFKNDNLEFQFDNNRKRVMMFNNRGHFGYRYILLRCKSCPFPDGDIYFVNNMPTLQFLYMNPNYSLDYEKDMLYYYSKLYDDILIPREEFIELTQKYNLDNMIGVQIRTGDASFYHNQNDNHDKYNPIKEADIDKYIKRLYDVMNVKNRNIYITTDNSMVIDRFKEVFSDNNVIYNENAMVHIDISKNTDNFIELFIDHYVMCKYPTELYVSDYSNFGRTMVLCNPTDKAYNLRGEKISKNKIVWQKYQPPRGF